MKVRYTLERGFGDDSEGAVYLALVDRDGDDVGGHGVRYPTEAEAKADAEQSVGEPLTWKPAPQDWQPDTYLVSNYYEDEGWDR